MKKIFLVLLYLFSSNLLADIKSAKNEKISKGIFASLFDVLKNIFKKKADAEVDAKSYQRLTFDTELDPNLTFDNIVGYEKEIEAVSNMLPVLKSKNSFKTPIILNGPSHSGKKTFVHAVAHMINAPTITIDCSKVIAKNNLSSIGVDMNGSEDIIFLQSIILEASELAKNKNGIVLIDKLEIFSEKYLNSNLLTDFFIEFIQFFINLIEKNNTVQFFFLFSSNYLASRFEDAIANYFNGEQLVMLLHGMLLFSDSINTEAKKRKLINIILQKNGIAIEEQSLFDDIYSLLGEAQEEGSIPQKMRYFSHQSKNILQNEGVSVLTRDIFNQVKNRVIPVFNKFFKKQTINPDEIIENFTLDDIMGYDEIKKILKRMIPRMQNPSLKQKGILLYGPPGTGKTQFIKGLAGSAGISLITLNPASITNKETTIERVFEKAEYKKPSILFIDEIDVLLMDRDHLSSLLIYLDGIKTFTGVTVIGITNFPGIIDDRISRPGRLSTVIEVSYPNKKDREKIVAYYIKKNDINFENEALLEKIVTMTTNKTGAQIKDFIENIKEYKEDHQQEVINEEILYSLFLEATIGKEKQYDIPHEELVQVAYHEAAHGFIRYILHKENKSLFDFDLLTIEPRQNALGMSIAQSTDVYSSLSKKKLEGEIQILLAGKASQELFCSQIDAGASEDLLIATDLAYKYVTLYGMGSSLASKRPVFALFENEVSKEIKFEVERLLQNNFSQVKSLLMKYKKTIKVMVDELLIKKRLYKRDIERIVENE